MRKRNFTSLEVLAEQVRKAELQIFGSQCRTKVRTWTFRSLAVMTERKRNFSLWQSRKSGSADAEHQVFGSQGRTEVWKRNFRSLAVKTERKCGSSTADLWQSSQVGRAEADLNIFDRSISYWLSLPMLKNNFTDCYIEGQCEDHLSLNHMTFAMRVTRWICSCKGSG